MVEQEIKNNKMLNSKNSPYQLNIMIFLMIIQESSFKYEDISLRSTYFCTLTCLNQ